MKNVLALAAGMCEGLGLGMNALASLITRGCREMTKYEIRSIFCLFDLTLRDSMGLIFGAKEETFYGLAGIGDAFGTCLGPLSRNRSHYCLFNLDKMFIIVFYRSVGKRLSQGEKLEDILQTLGGVSEGVNTVLALEQLIKTKVKANNYDFKFPIFAGVAKIIKGQMTPQMGLEALMRYPIYSENIQDK
jgi:glycerol-3-phosphate dehydrogenase (NAD(P)+)